MKKTPKLLFVSTLLFVVAALVWAQTGSAASRAKSEPADSEQSTAPLADSPQLANLTVGHFDVGGSVSISHTSAPGGRTTATTAFVLSAPIQYFVWDHISVGGTLAYSRFSSGGVSSGLYTIGPSATIYFWSQGAIAAYLGQSVGLTDYTDSDSFVTTETRLGLGYFITPSVSFGPSLNYSHRFKSGAFSELNQVSLNGVFSVYL